MYNSADETVCPGVTLLSICWWAQGIVTSDPAQLETGSWRSLPTLVNIVNHSGLLSALKRGETIADTLISGSIYFLSLSHVIHLTAVSWIRCRPVVSRPSSAAAGNSTPPRKFRETSTKRETQITRRGHEAKSVSVQLVLNYVQERVLHSSLTFSWASSILDTLTTRCMALSVSCRAVKLIFNQGQTSAVVSVPVAKLSEMTQKSPNQKRATEIFPNLRG